MENFKDLIKKTSKNLTSNIVLALDISDEDPDVLMKKCVELIKKVSPHICGVKFGRPLILRLSLNKQIRELIELVQEQGLITIMDAKINDVAHTNLSIATQYFDAGFDAIIASPFVGWDGGLDTVFQEASKRNKGIILLVHMSHKGASQGYGRIVIDPDSSEKIPQYIIFAKNALAWKADGAVVGATHPDNITIVKKILGEEIPIFAPGVIAQGASPKDAIKAGADYLIVGRGIFSSSEPEKSAKKIKDEANSAII
ncbi:orotidine 5'-phosphate decarboxylase [[Eubacterium] cellulosolvens]